MWWDTSTRIVTGKITEALNWHFVVDNRPGANGLYRRGSGGRRPIPTATPLLSAHTGEFAVNPVMFKSLPYDPLNSFTPVIMLSDAPMLVVVNIQSPINSIKELIAAARAKPGLGHVRLAGHRIGQSHGERVVGGPRPASRCCTCRTRGGAPAVVAVATNDVTFTVAGMPGVSPASAG